ncbi:SEC13 [Cordylochernes scorpioides]|uniref:Protein SEC13 homolog n=1 Tax=Cordylochernes scorpioides TaxID=51811 RepID=A0ABY6KBL7_9ARAC|nr:SEC13 [Cordylochernes scorpioides]
MPAGDREEWFQVSLVQTVDTSHDDMIHDAQLDYYGTMLATCSSDRSVKVFDIHSTGVQKLIADLKGHEGPVWQVAWGPPMYGKILASCSYDRKVILWKDTEAGWSKIYEYSNHESSVNSLSWAPYNFGQMLACASSDGAVSIIQCSGEDNNWTAKKINNAHTIGCNAVSWAPAIPPNSLLEGSAPQTMVKRIVTGGCDNLVKIWKYLDKQKTNTVCMLSEECGCREEAEEWEEEHRLEAHNDWVRDVAWCPSLGLTHSLVASCSEDRRVIIWRTTGPEGSWDHSELPLFDDVVWHVSWSNAGNILAVSGGDNKWIQHGVWSATGVLIGVCVQVSLWKESLDGTWVCISDVKKGSGNITANSMERNL